MGGVIGVGEAIKKRKEKSVMNNSFGWLVPVTGLFSKPHSFSTSYYGVLTK